MELGFDSENLVTMTIAPPERRYNNDDEIGVLYRSVLDGIHRLPNVEAAALTSSLTLTGADNKAAVEITPEIDSLGLSPVVSLRIVSSRFFETLSVPMLGGRSFDESDRESTAPVAVVNETFARRFFGNESVFGRQVRFGAGLPRDVVGVVSDFYEVRMDRPIDPVVYLPASQAWTRNLGILVRLRGGGEALGTELQQAVQMVDPELPAHQIRSMEDWVDRQAWVFRMMAAFVAILSIMTLLLGLVGVYGLTAHGVAQRTREIGIRIAHGATRSQTLSTIARRAFSSTIVGTVFALPLSVGISAALANRYFGVPRVGGLQYAVIALILVAATVGTAYLAAGRIVGKNPLAILRSD